MSSGLAVDLIRQAALLALLVAAPLLATALLVGIVVSVVQAVTQIQEQALTFIPKLLAMTAVFIVLLPWLLGQLVSYLAALLRSLPTLAT